MADEIVVNVEETPEAESVIEEVTEDDAEEAWRNSLSDSLRVQAEAARLTGEAMGAFSERLSRLESRLPENLPRMFAESQETVRTVVTAALETVRGSASSIPNTEASPEVVAVVEPEAVVESAEGGRPEAATETPAPSEARPSGRKRRRI